MTVRIGHEGPYQELATTSVVATGYKIDGAHFTVAQDGSIHDATGATVTSVTVAMQPYPLPLGTLRLQVFKDTVPVDSTYEADAEPGLAGFTTHLNDVLGEVTTDFYGNRLCTNYVHTKTLASTDVSAKLRLACV